MNNNPEDEERQHIADYFESNKNPAALVRDIELEIAAKGPAPVDLRTIPKEEWSRYLNYKLTLPPMIARYLAGREAGPIAEGEEESLCNAVSQWHDVRAPWYVNMDDSMREHGRGWSYVESLMFTGFSLRKDE